MRKLKGGKKLEGFELKQKPKYIHNERYGRIDDEEKKDKKIENLQDCGRAIYVAVCAHFSRYFSSFSFQYIFFFLLLLLLCVFSWCNHQPISQPFLSILFIHFLSFFTLSILHSSRVTYGTPNTYAIYTWENICRKSTATTILRLKRLQTCMGPSEHY